MSREVTEHLDPSRRRYQLTDQLGWHELSVTYRARDLQSGTWVAFRRPKPGIALESSEMRRFEREFELLASLRHPAVVRALEYGWDEHGPYYSTEYVEGRELITAGTHHWRNACANLRRVASALSVLHTRGILHGRLSPSRVLVTTDGAWKLSELSSSLPIGGTASLGGAYGAPESNTARLDARADVYSLGALAFFALTGEHVALLAAADPLAALSSLAQDAPAALGALLRSMVQVDRERRPASMTEVIARLGTIAELEPEPSAIAAELADSYLSRLPLQGQAGPLSVLTAALRAAEAGRGAALEVVGDGARRLVDELAQRAGFGPWERLRLDGLATPDLTHEAEHLAARLSARDQRPLLMVVEEAQRSTPEQLALYRQLAERVTTARALLLLRGLGAAQPGESHALRALRAQIETVAVEPLTREQTASLVRSAFGEVPNAEPTARRLHDASDGNAARVIAAARALVADGKAQLRDGCWSLPPAPGARLDGATARFALTANCAAPGPERPRLPGVPY